MSNAPESPRQILGNPIFNDLLRRVDFHAELLQRVKAGLPRAMAQHCKHCVVREDGTVIVYTDSQAFASQLRFLAPTLLDSLNAAGDLAVKQIVARNLVSTLPPVAEKPVVPMSKPSPTTIELIHASSKSASNDELGQALARLGAAMERYAREQTD